MMDEHPATFLHGSADPWEAAEWWRQRAMETARELNAAKEEIRRLQARRFLPHRFKTRRTAPSARQ
jgi:hypothetical protein